MIVTSAKVLSPSGFVLVDKPVDSVDKLLKVLEWRQRQRPLTPAGLPAQVWVLDAACVALGWGPDDIDPGDEADYSDEELRQGRMRTDLIARLDDATRTLLTPHLAPDGRDGWHLYQPGTEIGHRLHLSHTVGRRKFMVDVILEPWAMETRRSGHDRLGILGSESDGTLIDFDDEMDTAREMARRLSWHVEHLGVLPGITSARTGAVILDQIFRDRRKTGKGVVIDTPVAVPALDGADHEDLEPFLTWVREWIETEEIENADELITIDQRASYLASAGMIDLGYGDVVHHAGDNADQLAHTSNKLPFGVWQVTLPAADTLTLPTRLPLPHPHMRPDRPVTLWVTTETINSLCAPIADGGAGLDLADLAIAEAWTTTDQGVVLKRWKEILTTARKAAAETADPILKALVSDIYKGYLGRIAGDKNWDSHMRHHYQPIWAAAIKSHARHRSRVKAMKIAAEHDLWPIMGLTDAWTYLVPAGINLSDDSPNLGKFVVEKRRSITADDHQVMLDLLSAASPGEVRRAVNNAYTTAGLAADGDDESSDPQDAASDVSEEVAG
ncbi:hypothetical protein AAFP35_16545 [Gordonia sp. CPCC 206044]|uniref:hypothetical protein n=1 Tax=Gordonia sp. CPCC 206044 TaxID=3140793 RepID=UPI003AF3E046